MPDYTKEQIADITEREKKGLEALRALELSPAASVKKVIIGNSNNHDIFADAVIPFLQDTKYSQLAPKPQAQLVPSETATDHAGIAA